MTQTTGAMSFQDCYVAFSADGSTWTEVTGSANGVSVGGGDRQVGQQNTFGTTTPIVKYGGKAPLTVTVKALYTEETNEAFLMAQAAYDGDTAFYVRYSPGGGNAGDYGYTSASGKVMKPPYPGGEAASADPSVIEVEVHVGSIAVAAIGTAGW